MQRLYRVVGTTLVGGVLFLVPFVLTVVIVMQAVRLVAAMLAPMTNLMPAETVADVAVADVAAAALLLFLCFASGLVARTAVGTSLNQRVERLVLRRMPGFTFVKTAAQGLVGLETDAGVETALARIEDAWVPAFIVEKHRSGLLTVFVPSVPTPAAGTIYLLPEDRVRRLGVPVTALIPVIVQLGAGLRDLLEPDARPAPVSLAAE